MGEINTKHILGPVFFCLFVLVREFYSFPLMQPTVFIFPPQQFLPQNIPSPMMTSFRMAPKLMLRLRNSVKQTAAEIHERPSSDQTFLENNGIEPSNENPINVVNPNEDTVTIENNMINQQQFTEQPMNYPQNQQQYIDHSINYQHDQQQFLEQPMNYPQNQQQFPEQPVNYPQNQHQLMNYPQNLQFPDQSMNMQQYPDGRFSIGQIIMAVPFLPFEVNVPDTISWMYNGISSIIGSIGQRLPFVNKVPNEPRPVPYSAINGVNEKPMLMPFRLVQIPMLNQPMYQNVQPPFLLGRLR